MRILECGQGVSLTRNGRASTRVVRRYELICRHIRRVLPGFDRFQIEEQYGKVALRWRSRHSDKSYGAHLTSDGSLRFFALATLLNLPAEMLDRLVNEMRHIGGLEDGSAFPYVQDGPLLALEIGLERIRSECPGFDAWLRRLESLGEAAT